MPKLKTNKAAKKRYSLTATGKVKRTTANGRHRLATKTPRQKMSRKVNTYADKTVEAGIKKATQKGVLEKGDMIVISGGAKMLAGAEDSKIIGGIAQI